MLNLVTRLLVISTGVSLFFFFTESLFFGFSRHPGIIPRDGRNIAFREISTQVRETYNFSPSFCVYVLRYISNILNRSYSTGRFDLSDIDVHNGIEHDASLVRKCQTNNLAPSPTTPSIPKLAILNDPTSNLMVRGQGMTRTNSSTRACQTAH